ncbi:MAG: hypothetical protein IKZ07_09145 [Akkermansia sp.]|nr:hypothetical protein [Akkermansia sp.]
MSEEKMSKGTLQFTLWGIPVSIHPSSWVVLALLGGGLQVSSGGDLLQVAVFAVMGVLSLLAHEMGHALMGRKLTGSTPTVTLALMGGLTQLPFAPRTRAGYFLFVLAGPLGGFALGLLAAIIMGLHVGNLSAGIMYYLCSPFDAIGLMSAEQYSSLVTALRDGTMPLAVLQVYSILMLICMWWSLFNLLPIFPMDGAQLLYTLTDKLRLCSLIGLICGAGLTLLSVYHGMWFTMMLLGYFTYINWQIFRDSRGE